mmetsp:Transcript_26924/g.78081  ORF Transcript_26924/g.78081 Transcript_26924/m.78081 type:complete len:329 (+) Transcript_26924:843-1829(+)
MRDRIRDDPVLAHRRDKLRHTVHRADTCLRIDHGVVHDGVQRDTDGPHLAPRGHGALGLACVGEPLNDGGVHDGIRLDTGLPLLEEGDSLVNGLIAHERVEHTAQHDLVRLDATDLVHLAPIVPALVQSLQGAACLDQGTIGVHRRTERRGFVLGHDRFDAAQLLVTDASLEHRVGEDLVRAHRNARAVQQGEDSLHIARVVGALQALHHDGDGVVVDLDAILLHHADGRPSVPEVSRRRSHVQHAIVGHIVRTEALADHFRHQSLCCIDVSQVAISLQKCVVRDDVDVAVYSHLLKETLGALHFPRRHADIQHAVVCSRVDLKRRGL